VFNGHAHYLEKEALPEPPEPTIITDQNWTQYLGDEKYVLSGGCMRR
jgi:hypothetical protein